MNETACIAVVDDDAALRLVLRGLLKQAGYAVELFDSANAFLSERYRNHISLIISDLRMPGINGLEFLKVMQERDPDLPVIMISAHGTIQSAVDAMKLGAEDFVQKPFDRDDLLRIVKKALAKRAHADEQVPHGITTKKFIGESASFQALRTQIHKVATSKMSVLILGESGSGKELVAEEVHRRSGRKGPLISINCAALPKGTIESELFGHAKGAFSGANTARPGRFRLADGGSIFLDEIGELDLSVQPKLLRVLQEGQVQAVGENHPRAVDVRVIAATHRDLTAMVEDRTFREDLFFRLNVLPLQIPPLRERLDDIPPLVDHFLHEIASERLMSPEVIAWMKAQPWKGNVRELENAVERLALLSDGKEISISDVHRLFPNHQEASDGAMIVERREEAERKALLEALNQAGNNRTQAARILGVSRRTLYNKIAALGLIV